MTGKSVAEKFFRSSKEENIIARNLYAEFLACGGSMDMFMKTKWEVHNAGPQAIPEQKQKVVMKYERIKDRPYVFEGYVTDVFTGCRELRKELTAWVILIKDVTNAITRGRSEIDRFI